MPNEISETDEDDLRKRPDNDEDMYLKGAHALRPSLLGKIDHRELVNGPYKGPAEISATMITAAENFLQIVSNDKNLGMLKGAQLIGLNVPSHPIAAEAHALGVRLVQSADRIVNGKSVGQTRVNWLYNIHRRFDKLDEKIEERLIFSEPVERDMLTNLRRSLKLMQDLVKESGLQEAMPSSKPELPGR
jgi:hypothetical protein